MVNTEIIWIISFSAKIDKLYIVSKNKTAVCGSDHEHLIEKFRRKFKKIGKSTRPFKYDLNQIPYGYTVKVLNRFKELDLIDKVPEDYGQKFIMLCRRR